MGITKVYTLSPAFNAAKTLPSFLEGGDSDTTPIRRVYETLGERRIEYRHLTVNDNSSDRTGIVLEEIASRNPWLIVKHNEQNVGVAGVIQIGYNELVEMAKTELKNTAIGRLDCDLEHNPNEILGLVERLNQTTAVSGAISQLSYQREHQSDRDHAFDYSQGVIQGEVLLGEGRRFEHNCPGFSLWKADAMQKILPEYEIYMNEHQKKYGVKPTWDGDLAIMFCAHLLGYEIDTTIKVPSTRGAPNRTTDKVLAQIVRNTNHLVLMRELEKRLGNNKSLKLL